MNEIGKMLNSLVKNVSDADIAKINTMATIVAGICDMAGTGLLKGKIPMSPAQLKKIGQWASFVAMGSEMIIKYRAGS